MAGYIIVDVKTKKTIAICSAIALALFIVGILIGYFSGRPSNDANRIGNLGSSLGYKNCKAATQKDSKSEIYYSRYAERENAKNACPRDVTACLEHNMPRHYIAYHLNGRDIVMDGKLDDLAWKEVPWTENFLDIRSAAYGPPRLCTKVKVRWDNERIYFGAYLEETDIWATFDEHDSSIWKENNFEVVMDVDGSMFNYKQVQINVLGTMLDLMLYKSPFDDGSPEISWHPDVRKEIYTEGTVNTPGDVDKFWSIEMSFSFAALLENSENKQYSPDDNDVWFMQFGRSEQRPNITADGKYKTIRGAVDWWFWQPMGAINVHLQDRWGLVQFKRSLDDKRFHFEKWHIYKALFDTRDALKSYKAINGIYTDQVEELPLPPYLFSRACVDIPEIRLMSNRTNFEVTVKSLVSKVKPGHIKSDKYVFFQ